MSTTEPEPQAPQQVTTIDGVPIQMVLDHLSDRGQVEVQLAVAKARGAILSANNEVLQEQVATLDAQVVAMMSEREPDAPTE